MTNAFHSNSIEDNGERIYGGEAGGYIVRFPGGVTLYHAGDTAVFGDMKLIGEIYKPEIAMAADRRCLHHGPRVKRRSAFAYLGSNT